jgi:hypothetical protein
MELGEKSRQEKSWKKLNENRGRLNKPRTRKLKEKLQKRRELPKKLPLIAHLLKEVNRLNQMPKIVLYHLSRVLTSNQRKAKSPRRNR